MHRQMRRNDRALSDTDAREILERGEYGVLSTVSSDGQPYGVPVSYSCVDDVVYFHCAPEGHKLDNIEENDRVSFCVVGQTELLPEKFSTKFESVILFGRASQVTGEEKQAGLEALLKKYSGDYIQEGLRYIENSADKAKVYKITIELITGKARR